METDNTLETPSAHPFESLAPIAQINLGDRTVTLYDTHLQMLLWAGIIGFAIGCVTPFLWGRVMAPVPATALPTAPVSPTEASPAATPH